VQETTKLEALGFLPSKDLEGSDVALPMNSRALNAETERSSNVRVRRVRCGMLKERV
jgi:hypothetical protein